MKLAALRAVGKCQGHTYVIVSNCVGTNISPEACCGLQVIYSAKQRAATSPNGWKYAANSAVSGQSGSGNNWALGHNKYGPMMSTSVMDLVRRQVGLGLYAHHRPLQALWHAVYGTDPTSSSYHNVSYAHCLSMNT